LQKYRFIHPERGFLVYDVFVLDSSNNIHRAIVDPGNGKVLSNQPMSLMDMMSMMHPSMGLMMGAPAMMMTTAWELYWETITTIYGLKTKN
jgi:hypothetical protein